MVLINNNEDNLNKIKSLYSLFLNNPKKLELDWYNFFSDLDENSKKLIEGNEINKGVSSLSSTNDEVKNEAIRALRARLLIRAYRVGGHLKANLDPLELVNKKNYPDLDPSTYGFNDNEYEKDIYMDGVFGLERTKLGNLIKVLEKTYCGTIGVQFMHIEDKEQRDWIMSNIENMEVNKQFTVKGKKAILERLTAAEYFEQFLDKKYTGTKRFGLEGGESLIPALEQILKHGGKHGIEEVVVGMPHRGRLNVLANFMKKPFSAIFSEFQGNASQPDDVQGSGDVKYHLGTSSDRNFDNINVHLSLTANPSHLEAVNPVVVGKVRAKQDQRKDINRQKVVGLLMHGDAAFSGQGLVPETLDLSGLKGYRTGGTIHFIVNNQIGFTTNPVNSRSGPYCSDVALMVQAPIFHVNGDDPEAVVYVSRIATEFRQKFNKDVVIDMFCYRRQGHNESDEPAFTQPHMYDKIRKHPTTRTTYSNKLVSEGVISKEEPKELVELWHKKLEKDLEVGKSYKTNKADWLEGKWTGLNSSKANEDANIVTGINEEKFLRIGKSLFDIPKGFTVNKKVLRQLSKRNENIKNKGNIDWANAESLALGTLLSEGISVRLSGQDCGRGTFSQRHAILIDQINEDKFSPVSNCSKDSSLIEIVDSPLSEASVLGFEYGYSLAEPKTLVIWEAQFGDFVNGAQLIIDQFISSGESKWLRMSGITMLLPHGYEGQGPEHSSARIERFLQSCAEDNLQIVNCSTPANYYHVLRRQMHRKFRKPLIIFTPKSLLRHKAAVSNIEEFINDTKFKSIIHYNISEKKASIVKKVIICTGKIFYELDANLPEKDKNDVFIIRVEELYPFPYFELKDILSYFKNSEFIWCQEEPKNMGPWTYISFLINEVLSDLNSKISAIKYVGRPSSASTATGLYSRHLIEQKKIIDEALYLSR